MRVYIALVVVTLVTSAACSCAALQFAENAIFSCIRHSTWHPSNLGPDGPRCLNVHTSVEHLLQFRRTADPGAFARGAWIWLDDASLCVFAARHQLTYALSKAMLDNLVWHHKLVLRLVLLADQAPIRLPKEACAPYVAATGSLNMLNVQGIKVHSKVAVKYFERNNDSPQDAPASSVIKIRGVYAKSSIKNGTRIIHVPISSILDRTQLPRSKLWPAIEDLLGKGTDNDTALLLVTAFEMLNAPSSMWLPLICNFPEGYSELPFHWNASKFESFAHIHALRDNVDINTQYWSSRLLQDVAYVNFKYKHILQDGLPSKYFIWAAFASRSRAFGLPGGNGLVPVADLLNHDHNPHVSVKFEMMMQPGQSQDEAVPNSMDMILTRDVEAGHEILSSYGARCKRLWLSFYGFLPQETDEHCVGD